MLQRASVVTFFLVLMPATVEAFDHHHHHHSSSGGDGCGSSSSDAPESDPSTSPPPASATVKRVFVTSTSYSGALGGLPSADAQCQSRAIAHGLPGVFRAWLSDATTNEPRLDPTRRGAAGARRCAATGKHRSFASSNSF